MAVFVAILFVGYFYILGKGALDWDEGRPAEQRPDRKLFARRLPIRFGNEDSGTVKLPAVVQVTGEDLYTSQPAIEAKPPAMIGR